ncbi:hypothetical protein RvY_18939 [Ramazzottius varieornatus]|uniref:DH domain-containing protein n=1 Tax=Ramazzottius varieornatus TaxID=947166 RepID=A0A1D1W7M6_RAMVA|nr:hypothetical protein RvY_18939 [Ramazzottius varieornatus]
MGTEARLVKAIYDFVQQNVDELSFRRGDVITLTQSPDGGWWEGTLRNETGWFPAEFVVDHSPETNAQNGHVQDPRREFRRQIMGALLDSERAHVKDLLSFQNNFLRPLKAGNLLAPGDFNSLCGNLEEVTQLQSLLLERLSDISRSPSEQQAVGGLFMSMAAQMQTAYLKYCANHPHAAQILNQYKDTLMAFAESLEDNPLPKGIMSLAAEVSRPFRRLDKYPAILQELERHLEEFHSDRGNTQRSVAVYTDLANQCTKVRQQKEIELEISKGNIRDYQGPDMASLGEVLLMEQVSVGDEANGTKQDRHLVLFEEVLLLLAVSRRMSSFMYMSHTPLLGLKIKPLSNGAVANTFEIWSKTLDWKVVQCKSKESYDKWLAQLNFLVQKASIQKAVLTPAALGKCSTLPKPSKVSSISALTISPPKTDTVKENTLRPVATCGSAHKFPPPIITNSVWSGSCLRPYPPMRADVALKEEKASALHSPKLPRKFSTKKKEQPKLTPRSDELLGREQELRQYEDDAKLLAVIESYCISSKLRQKVTSEVLDSPHVLIPEEEKILIEHDGPNGSFFLEEKTLVDAVYTLKDQVRDLSLEVAKLRGQLEEEGRARKRLEASLQTQQPMTSPIRHTLNDPSAIFN